MKKKLLILTFFILLISCKSNSCAVSKNEPKRVNKNVVLILIEKATDNIGAPYKAAGTTKKGFDCSGLVYTTFASENIPLPRSSFDQSKIGRKIELDNAKKGDLIFFKTNNSDKINHVGLIVEINKFEIKFVHSSTSQGVIISSTKEPYYTNSFAQINRVIE